MKLKKFITKLVKRILSQPILGFNNLINKASKMEMIQYKINNSERCERLNSVLLKIKNKRIPNNNDPMLAMIESTRLFEKRSNLKTIMTSVSMITVNMPMPTNTKPTLTRLQSTESKTILIIFFIA